MGGNDVITGFWFQEVGVIQFNSKSLFKDGDSVSLQLNLPWDHPNILTIRHFTYIYTKQHRSIGQRQTTYTFIQKHTLTHSYLTYKMYIQTCTFTTLSLLNTKEHYIDNNRHVEQERC